MADPEVCLLHSGIEEGLTNLKQKVKSVCDIDKDQWDHIENLEKEKVPMRLFYVLITVLCLLFAGIFGLNLSVRSTLVEVQTVQAVMVEKLK